MLFNTKFVKITNKYLIQAATLKMHTMQNPFLCSTVQLMDTMNWSSSNPFLKAWRFGLVVYWGNDVHTTVLSNSSTRALVSRLGEGLAMKLTGSAPYYSCALGQTWPLTSNRWKNAVEQGWYLSLLANTLPCLIIPKVLQHTWYKLLYMSQIL